MSPELFSSIEEYIEADSSSRLSAADRASVIKSVEKMMESLDDDTKAKFADALSVVGKSPEHLATIRAVENAPTMPQAAPKGEVIYSTPPEIRERAQAIINSFNKPHMFKIKRKSGEPLEFMLTFKHMKYWSEAEEKSVDEIIEMAAEKLRNIPILSLGEALPPPPPTIITPNTPQDSHE